MVVQKSK